MKIYISYFVILGISFALSHDIKFSLMSTGSENIEAIYLFAHGLGASHEQAKELMTSSRWIINSPLASFDFLDAKSTKNDFDRKRVCLGQEQDIECLKLAYNYTRKNFPNCPIVLVGISRGATTILNFLALCEHEGVKAAVLESPFDTLSAVVQHLLKRYCLSWMPFSKQMADAICESYFPNINPKGIFPRRVIDKIPKNTPIMLIHSKKDKVIPVQSSRAIYAKLRNEGNPHVFLVELISGAHGKLLQGADADLYFYCVHAFYHRYRLPYNKDAAQKGDFFLSQSQPDAFKFLRTIQYFSEDSAELTMKN